VDLCGSLCGSVRFGWARSGSVLSQQTFKFNAAISAPGDPHTHKYTHTTFMVWAGTSSNEKSN